MDLNPEATVVAAKVLDVRRALAPVEMAEKASIIKGNAVGAIATRDRGRYDIEEPEMCVGTKADEAR